MNRRQFIIRSGALFAPLVFPVNLFASRWHKRMIQMYNSAGASCTVDSDSLQFAMASVSANTTEVGGVNYRGVTLLEGTAYTITSISVYCVDTSSDTGSIVAELYTFSSPDPTGSVLATSTVACSELPNTAAQYEFVFASPYALAGSTDYVITFRGIDGGSMNIYRDSTASISNSHIIYSYNSGVDWANDLGYDLRADGVNGCS
jgi:hypothetical protein